MICWFKDTSMVLDKIWNFESSITTMTTTTTDNGQFWLEKAHYISAQVSLKPTLFTCALLAYNKNLYECYVHYK